MRIVLDTNIFVSALITKGTPPDQLYQAWLRNDIDLVTSVTQIEEITDVLARPKLRRFVDPDEAAQMVSAIHLRAIVVDDMPVPKRSPDPKDDVILATAVAGQAALLVTGDKRDILALGTVEGIPICTARDALQIALAARSL
ncbi:putative toxin-antitoxin system toxin component, PIN family [Candidatus Rariloculus sp.]|uniref:putative toxin-antitoxin system toxin component, PIN family n=1 Tax=Candidatus Rariloculus sp. TaxID=3101265 RepID=UPI003D1097A1